MSEAPETEAVRRQLADAWRAVGNRLIAEGYNPADVTSAMLSVAVASWSGLLERPEAARQLRAIADRVEQSTDGEEASEGLAA